ncbi:MAG: hypothetical protein C0629_00565 [Chromatiales bacterium]|nr:MAG: hypothetical protein C0629_00565 [Chromatiales bacterium]
MVANGNGGLTQIRIPYAVPDESAPVYLGRQNARNVDMGNDPETGIRWGRWADGNVNVKTPDVDHARLQLGDGGLHWILAEGPRPELPASGTREFSLVGGTKPTDNHGNTGILGGASLTADFTSQTVDAAIELSLPASGTEWAAEANGLDINVPAATFGGQFDSVTVTGSDGLSSNGVGNLGGFFSGDADGGLGGAGFGYSLSDGDDTTVSGTAAFEVQPER